MNYNKRKNNIIKFVVAVLMQAINHALFVADFSCGLEDLDEIKWFVLLAWTSQDNKQSNKNNYNNRIIKLFGSLF